MLSVTGRALAARLGVDLAPRGLLHGASSFIAIRAAGGLLLYVSQVLLAQWLGAIEFGLFSQAWAWAFVLATVASLGVPNAAVRFMPLYLVHDDTNSLLRFLSWAWWVVLGAGLVVVLASGLLLSLAGHLLQPGVDGALLIAILAVPFLAASLLQVQIARALGQIALAFAPMQVLRPAAFIVLGFVVVAFGGDRSATMFLLLSTASVLLVIGVQARQIRRLLPSKRHRPERSAGTDAAGGRRWLRTSLPMLAFSGAQIALTESGIIMVGLLLPPEEVGIYAAAARTANLLTMMAMAIDNVTIPRIAALHAEQRSASIDRLLRSAIRWAFALSLIMLLAMLVGGELILELFGTGFADGWPVLLILASGLLARAALAPAPAILNVTGHQDVVTVASLGVLGAGLALSVPLILEFGLVGAALSQAAMMILLRATLLGVLRRRLGVSGMIALTPSGPATARPPASQ